MGTPQRRVIDERLGSADVGTQALDGGHGHLGLSPLVTYECPVEDDPSSLVGPTGSEEDELGPPRRLPRAFEVEIRIWLMATGPDLSRRAVDSHVARPGPVQRGDHLAVAIEHPALMGVGPRPRPGGIVQSGESGHPFRLKADTRSG